MKKIIFIISLIFIVNTVYAKSPSNKKAGFFDKGRTKFAMGIDISAMASNSYVQVPNLFKETLVIDLNEMSKKLPKSGFNVSALGFTRLFLDIFIKDKASFGLSTQARAYAIVNIPKDIIDFAANGNGDGKTIEGNLNSTASAFASQNLYYGMKIKKFSFKINAAWFLPVAYLDKKMGSYEYVNDPETGRVYARGTLNAKLYSPLPIFGQENKKIDANELLKSGGFDLDFFGAYTFNKYATLNFGVINIPILPAKMKKGLALEYTGDFEIKSLIAYLNKMTGENSGEEPKPEGKYTTKKSFELPEMKIFRPLKAVVSSDIYPFKNNYLIITPSIGVHCLKPFYIDGGLKIESHFAKVLGLYIATNREDKIWKNKLGFFIDSRIFRLDIAGSVASPSFVDSFKLTGAQVDLNLVFGY